MENFQYLQFEFNLNYQNLDGSCKVDKRKCLVRLEADSFNRVRGQERAIATMMFYKSIVADLIVHHKQHHRQGRDDEKQSCSGPVSHIMLLDDGEQHRSSHSLLRSQRRPYDWHSRWLLSKDAW